MRKVIMAALVLFLAGIVSATASEPWGKADYTIEAVLHDSTQTVTAHQTVTYFNRSPHILHTLEWAIHPNAANGTETNLARESKRLYSRVLVYAEDKDLGSLEVSQVSIGGTPALWKVDPENPDLASLPLPTPLQPGDSITVEMDFTLHVPGMGLMRLERRGSNYNMTQWYPKLAVYDERGWNPYTYLEMGEFYEEFGDYDVSITVPKGYIVAATGTPVDENEIALLDSLSNEADRIYAIDDKKEMKQAAKKYSTDLKADSTLGARTVHYTAKSVIDFAWFASKDFMVQIHKVKLPGSNREVRCETYVHPSHADVYKDAGKWLENTILFMSQQFGEYPYPKVAVVDQGPSSGGMEYPMITLVGSFPFSGIEEFVIVHEVAHNWFFGILANDQREWPWLDESFATYATTLYLQHYYPEGRNLFDGKVADLGLTFHASRTSQLYLALADEMGMEFPTTRPAEDYPNLAAYSMMVYERGANAFLYLRHFVGEEKFDQAMREYLQSNWMNHPTRQDLVNSLERSTGMDLGWFFNDYLDLAVLPDFSIDLESVRQQGGDWQVAYEIEDANKTVLPADIRFEGSNGESHEIWLKPGEEGIEQTIELPFKPVRAVVDPLNLSGDPNLSNNYSRRPYRISLPLHLPNPEYRELFVMPWANYQFTEGLILGGRISNSLLLPGHPDISVTGGYGFVSGDGNFRAKLSGKPLLPNRTMRGMYEISGMEWAGFRQLKAGIGLKYFSRYDEDHHNQQFQFWTHINDVADPLKFDPTLWSMGKHADAQMLYMARQRYLMTNIDLDAGLTKGLSINGGSDDFSKVDFALRVLRRINRNNRLYLRAFHGQVLDDKSMPLQQYYYASGGVDPNFDEPNLPDRTGATWFSHSRNLVGNAGTLVRGYSGLYANKAVTATSLEWRHGSFRIFGDAGRFDTQLSDGEWVESFGVTLDQGMVQLHLPLWISDPLSGSSWIAMNNARDRIYLSLHFSSLTAGLLF